MPRNSAFSRPKKQSNSSYWAARHREEDAAAKRAEEEAAQKIVDSAQFNEENFPTLMNVPLKAGGWSGPKFSDIAAKHIEKAPVEQTHSPKAETFTLPVFPRFRRITRETSDEDWYRNREYEEQYEEDYEEIKEKPANQPTESLDDEEETGEQWVEVRPKIKIRREKTLEENYPEPEETVWGEDDEDESCWDSRGRKLRG